MKEVRVEKSNRIIKKRLKRNKCEGIVKREIEGDRK
jgi:hypothetical protein